MIALITTDAVVDAVSMVLLSLKTTAMQGGGTVVVTLSSSRGRLSGSSSSKRLTGRDGVILRLTSIEWHTSSSTVATASYATARSADSDNKEDTIKFSASDMGMGVGMGGGGGGGEGEALPRIHFCHQANGVEVGEWATTTFPMAIGVLPPPAAIAIVIGIIKGGGV